MGPESARRRATYEDIVALPDNVVGEIVYGVLEVSPRPAPPHAIASSVMGGYLGPPFQNRRGGPGGWWILDEPELHLGEHVLVPDLGGTVRLERLVGPGKAALLTLACHRWTGDQAYQHGLVELLCEPGAALASAITLAGDIRAGAPTAATGVLQVLRASGDLDLDDALVLETEAGTNALLSGEPLEGLMAHQARRAPAWHD